MKRLGLVDILNIDGTACMYCTVVHHCTQFLNYRNSYKVFVATVPLALKDLKEIRQFPPSAKIHQLWSIWKSLANCE